MSSTVLALCGITRGAEAERGAPGATMTTTAQPQAPSVEATVTDMAGPEVTREEATVTTTAQPQKPGAQASKGRLVARPAQVTTSAPAGLHQLGIVSERDTLLYVPPGYRVDRPAPLAVMLHGAGGDAPGSLGLLQSLADEQGLLLLGPASRDSTWDVIRSNYGPDITLIDRALAHVFSQYAVDPRRLAVGGFSDGASYALSVGITNGDLFTHVIAFSPGFMAPASQQGTPRLFISHGTRDTVLPIDRCSRRIVPRLQEVGYDVLYREFDGPHTVPSEIAREAVDWYIAGQQKPS